MPHAQLGWVSSAGQGCHELGSAGPELTLLSVLSNPELVLSQGLPAHPGLLPATEILPVVPYCSQKKHQCLNHF